MSVLPNKSEMVPYRCTPVPIVVVHDARSAAEKKEEPDFSPWNEEDLALLVAPNNSETRSTTAAQQVVLRAICETLVWDTRQMAGLEAVVPHDKIIKCQI